MGGGVVGRSLVGEEAGEEVFTEEEWSDSVLSEVLFEWVSSKKGW